MSCGAQKVVNKTLGNPKLVCSRLVDAALQDMDAQTVQAKSVLHGLSDWVQSLKDFESIEELQDMDPTTQEALICIARNQAPDLYTRHKQQWEILAKAFLADPTQVNGEAALYQSKGAQLAEILHQADESEFSDTCAGAMAVFEFSR